MARNAKQLLERIRLDQSNKATKALLDKFQKTLDRELDEKYTGGEFVYEYCNRISDSVKDWLRLAYKDWIIYFDDKFSGDYFLATIIRMKPESLK